MTFSLGEAGALAVKAARGAGYPWGMAEEAGRAVRWCHARSLDGCGALAGLLTDVEACSLDDAAPCLRGGLWCGVAGPACPICLGAALSDRAQSLIKGVVETGPVLAPLLILPFLSDAARAADTSFRIQWAGGAAVLGPAGQVVMQAPPPGVTSLSILGDGGALPAAPHRHSRADPAAATWQTLLTFAHRTYAPATEASRLRGAGDGRATSD